MREQIITLEAQRTSYRLKPQQGLTPTQKIIRRYTQSAPVDIFSMAKDLGFTVIAVDLVGNSGEIFRDFRRGGFNEFTIRVNASHPRVRQRVTVAHEIAHFMIHRKRIENRLVDDKMYRSKPGKGREAEANRLASQLSIPGQLLKQFRETGIQQPEKLAAIFDVSVPAMRIRLGIRT